MAVDPLDHAPLGFDAMPSQAVDPPAESPTAPEPDELPYRVESWRGIESLECHVCPWSTTEGRPAMLEHIRGRHITVPQPTTPSGLVASDGITPL